MKGSPVSIAFLSALLSMNIHAQQDDQQIDYNADKLTNISNENGTAFYLKLGLGAVRYTTQKDAPSGVDIKFESGFSLHATAGKNIGKHAAVELELNRQRSNFRGTGSNGVAFNHANTDYQSAMINFIFKPKITNSLGNFNPYAGAGLGLSRVSYSVPASPFSKRTDTVKAHQYFLGNTFILRDNFFIDAEYRYFKTENPQVAPQTGDAFDFDNSATQSLIISYGKNF